MKTGTPSIPKSATCAGILVIVSMLSLWPLPNAEADATTLFGIDGFRVDIGRISNTARALGFDEAQLRVLTRERLRRAAVPLGDFSAVLHISLHTIEHSTTILAYCLDVEVRQIAQLKRTKQMEMLAPTWAEGSLTMVTRTSFTHSVTNALASLLDALIRDYRLVNKNPTEQDHP
jgi:hypothetical protein